MSSATVIVPTLSGARAERLLASLAASGGAGSRFQTVLVDNGSGDPAMRAAAERLEGAELIELDSNRGYSGAVNLAAGRAEGEALIVLNDDCVVEPEFVDRLTEALDPGRDVVMSAAVLRDAADPELIDTAGMELDATLLVFDYLNGEPLSVIDRGVADPVGPSGAAAAILREAFLESGGFDENLFAYWEDVDLVLRLRRSGGRCRLATLARGTHQHSATLGSGSARKNYLVGFGRGYVLRKWGVLSPRRLPAVLVRDLTLCAGQAVVDRNLSGLRGRVRGLRASRRQYEYPANGLGSGRSARSTLARRWRRRSRLRASR
jgi:N-acetylglucosaminyl-diphospho-decaprenol L-rhamnosyltransferase